MTEDDERRLAELRRLHIQDHGDPAFCAGCNHDGCDWPCNEAFLLGVIDEMEKEHEAQLQRACRVMR